MIKIALIPMLLVGFACFWFYACEEEKPTIVRGFIADRKTGDPIEDARVEFAIKSISNATGYSAEWYYTDKFGYFEAQFNPGFYDIRIGNVIKAGYLPNYDTPAVLKEHENDLLCDLLKMDAVLSHTTKNKTGLYDTLFFRTEIPSLLNEFPWYGSLFANPSGPHRGFVVGYYQQVNESFNTSTDFPSNEPIVFHWDFKSFKNFDSQYSDTLYLTQNDTLYYLFEY